MKTSTKTDIKTNAKSNVKTNASRIRKSLKIKVDVKAGGLSINHNHSSL